MRPSTHNIREAVIAENLFVQSFKNRNYKICEKYILGNKIDGINLSKEEFINEFENLENQYRPTNLCCFLIDPSTSPKDLSAILVANGYSKDVNYDDIWWFKRINQVTSQQKPQEANLIEINNIEQLKEALKDTELAWWIDVFGKGLKETKGDLTIRLYVGQINGITVSTYASAFYKGVSIYKGAEVTEESRRKGINTQMMHHWLNQASNFGCRWAVFQTDSKNIASIGTGKKLGFEEAFRKESYCKNL